MEPKSAEKKIEKAKVKVAGNPSDTPDVPVASVEKMDKVTYTPDLIREAKGDFAF